MEAHCSTGDPCETVKEASFFYLRNRCHVVFKKNRIESSHCAFTFYLFNIAPLHQKDNTNHANSCFSALLLIAFFSNYTMCSKPLYNLLLIFFLAAVPFIYFDRAFYDPLRTQSATLQQNSPFLLLFPVFAQLFVSHAPVCGGAWRLGGRLVGGMAGLRRTVPVFLRRDGYTAPLQTVCGVCGGGCVFGGLHARQRDAVLPLQRGAGLLQICHSLFCPPCPAPDSRFPLADFYLRQLLRCI